FFEPAPEEMHLGNVWFQQDGATAHTTQASMWGYLKGEVFKHCPKNLLQLKNVIWQEVAQILVHMVEHAEGNFRKQLHQCIENGGHHLQVFCLKLHDLKL
ncbi:hypothetical protein B7P43_G15090, partial [Cryptotermes secundus]